MMTRLYGLPSVRIPNLSPSRMSHPRATTSSQEWRFARLTPGPLSYLTGPSGVRSRNNKEDLFWIRNRSRILVHNRIPDLGSEYGNQPYRGFHVQIVPPSCPGHRAQHQRVRHCASQHLVHSADDLRTVLRWRSGRASALRTSQHLVHSADDLRTVLRWRSGRASALRTSQHLVHSADDLRTVLRWRSGRASALRTSQHLVHSADDLRTVLRWRSGRASALRASQRLIRNADDLRTVLRWRSGRASALRSRFIARSEGIRWPLISVGRLSDPRDGQ